MSLYDNYQLDNSTQTPAYVGSDVATKVSVLSQLQDRYNKSQQSDDMLSRMAQDNTNVYSGDTPLYNQVVDQYRKNIAQRAQSGNYEDMQLGTTKDAYDFSQDIKPFATNKGLIQARLAEIQKMSDKGPGGTDGKGGGGIGAETADLLRQELGQYTGLKKDQTSGQYSNYYSGHAIAPDINVDARVKEWAGDIVSRKLGYEVKAEEGVDGQLHYVTRGGSTETVSPDQIKAAINYGSQSDQGFKDFLHQQQRLKTMGTDKVTYDQVANQGPQAKSTADSIQAEADRQGTSFGNVYRQMRMQGVQNEIASNAYGYGMKYVKNDSDTKTLDDGLTEGAKKKLDDSDTNFAIPVTLGAYGSDFDTPDKLAGEQQASVQRQQAAQAGLKDWISTNGIKQVGGKYIDQNGTDVTDQAMRQQLLVKQEQAHQATLKGIDDAAKKEAGFNPTAQDLADASKARQQAMNVSAPPIAPGAYMSIPYTQTEKEGFGQAAYNAKLRDVQNYDKYEQIIKQKAQQQTLTTSAMRFADKKDNDKLEELANNLSTPDFKNTLLGLKHVGTQQNGEPLTPDEYDAVKGNIHFAGQVVGADGYQHSIFKAVDPKSKKEVQFEMDGVSSTQPMPKLLGVDANQLYTQQMIREATNNQDKTAHIPLSGSAQLNVRVLGPDEAGIAGRGKYVISVTGKDGKGGTEQNVDDESQLLQKVIGIQKVAGHGE